MELEEGVIKDICNKIRRIKMLNLVACSGNVGPMVGWVFIVSNLHFVSELVQCVCLDITFNVGEVQNVVIVRFCLPRSPPLPHNFSGHA